MWAVEHFTLHWDGYSVESQQRCTRTTTTSTATSDGPVLDGAQRHGRRPGDPADAGFGDVGSGRALPAVHPGRRLPGRRTWIRSGESWTATLPTWPRAHGRGRPPPSSVRGSSLDPRKRGLDEEAEAGSGLTIGQMERPVAQALRTWLADRRRSYSGYTTLRWRLREEADAGGGASSGTGRRRGRAGPPVAVGRRRPAPTSSAGDRDSRIPARPGARRAGAPRGLDRSRGRGPGPAVIAGMSSRALAASGAQRGLRPSASRATACHADRSGQAGSRLPPFARLQALRSSPSVRTAAAARRWLGACRD